MRILVTGATGYIGGRLVPRLFEGGHSVRCLARNATRLAGRFSGAEIIEGDVFDEHAVRAACKVSTRPIIWCIRWATPYGLPSATGMRPHFSAGLLAKSALRALSTWADWARTMPTLSRHLASRHEVGAVLRAAASRLLSSVQRSSSGRVASHSK